MNLIDAKSWAEGMDVRVTVCDLKGTIVYMNQASALGMHKYGGVELIGKSLFACHNSRSGEMIAEMLNHPVVNVYMVEKAGERRLIRQFPWEEDGEHCGVIEISFPVPFDIPVKVRS
ncbi:MAG TPA: PAS domain-containing protein [Prolixibacteraceae bacterium]|nr:PAS domain-containing protein [Prolixibacteraceae bacterium]